MELDRDIRTIFAYNLPLKATEQDLFNFFATAGKIVDVKIIMDRNTRRSKGFAYIEYAQRVRLSSTILFLSIASPHYAFLCLHSASHLLALQPRARIRSVPK